MGLPQVTLGFDTCEWSKKMDDLGSPYDLGHFHIYIYILYIIIIYITYIIIYTYIDIDIYSIHIIFHI